MAYCSILPVFARIGENEAQCIQRYGAEVTTTDAGTARSAEFKDNFVIVVTFFNGTSVCEAYKKTAPPAITDAEIAEIIDKNGGQGWQFLGNATASRRWGPADGSSEPGASFQSSVLVVWSIGGRNALALLKNSSEKAGQVNAQQKAQQTTSGL